LSGTASVGTGRNHCRNESSRFASPYTALSGRTCSSNGSASGRSTDSSCASDELKIASLFSVNGKMCSRSPRCTESQRRSVSAAEYPRVAASRTIRRNSRVSEIETRLWRSRLSCVIADT
jgi:hypothetical protein